MIDDPVVINPHSAPLSPVSISVPLSSSSPVSLKIGLWNAHGLMTSTIDDVLRHCQDFSVLFITETWLLPSNKLFTSWQQFHLYGVPVDGNWRGSRGVSCLVNPSCPLSAFRIPIQDKPHALGIQLGRSLKLICLYLPPDPSLRNALVPDILASIPLTSDTIICGDLNARMGDVTGDSDSNTRGNLVQDWCADRSLSILNPSLAFGVPTFVDFRRGVLVSSIVDYLGYYQTRSQVYLY
jgi:hypothetical protein